MTVVEIGDRTTYESAHIPGARFVALADIAITRNGVPNELPAVDALEKVLGAAGVPDRGRLVLYARDSLVAARGFFTLDYLGCALDAALLDGGFAKWSAENRAVERGAPSSKPRTFAACPHPDAVVNIGAMRKLIDIARQYPRAVTIVDGRPVAMFDAGRIATALSVPWDQNLTGGMTPVFRDANDLRALYRDTGVDDDAAVVVYCRTGMQAAVGYFVLRALGARRLSLRRRLGRVERRGERHDRANAVVVRYFAYQSAASDAARSSVPGSSKRCVAPGTISNCFGPLRCSRAWRLAASTAGSLPPTMSSAGVVTASRCAARSGRPPRETSARTASGRAAAASSAAAAPVLAPKRPIGSVPIRS